MCNWINSKLINTMAKEVTHAVAMETFPRMDDYVPDEAYPMLDRDIGMPPDGGVKQEEVPPPDGVKEQEVPPDVVKEDRGGGRASRMKSAMSSRSSALSRMTTSKAFLTSVPTDSRRRPSTDSLGTDEEGDDDDDDSSSSDSETQREGADTRAALEGDDLSDLQDEETKAPPVVLTIDDNSDQYDTDLEEDFPKPPDRPTDNTGKYIYAEVCEKRGIVPVSYLLRNMDGGNLRMRHHYLGGDGTRPLAEALKNNTLCEEVDLTDNYLEGTGAAALASMLKENMFIVNLNISYNFIKSHGLEAFAEMLEANTTLKTLSLQGNQLTDTDARRIAEAMRSNMSLGVLDLSHNNFGDLGGVYIAGGIATNIGLADLDLSWNGIREKGAIAVGKAISKNGTLEILDVSWNGFSDAGCTAVAESLRKNKTLKVLDLSNNRITTEGAVKLGAALAKNQGLETLLFGMNNVQDPGIDAILKGIATNKTLKLVGLEDISMSPEVQARIDKMMEGRDLLMMYTTGSPQTAKMNQIVLAVFERFIMENADRMEDLFNQMDKDKSGAITLEEFKYGLKDFGLRLTSKQMDSLLDFLDADKSGTIEFDELMSGFTLIDQEKQKREANEALFEKGED